MIEQGSAYFDGVDDYAETEREYLKYNGPQVTAFHWINRPAGDATTGWGRTLSAGGRQDDDGWSFEFTGDATNIYASWYYDLFSGVTIGSGETTQDDTWHSLAATFDNIGDLNSYYFDGAFSASSGNLGVPRTPNPEGVRVGEGDNGQRFNGYIAHVAVWDCILTAGEIAQLHAGVNPLDIRRGSLVGYWPACGRDVIGHNHMVKVGAVRAMGVRAPVNPPRGRTQLLPATTPASVTRGVVPRGDFGRIDLPTQIAAEDIAWGGSPRPVTPPTGLRPGDTLIVALNNGFTTVSDVSVSDNAGNVYVQDFHQDIDSTHSFFRARIKAVPTSINYNFTGSSHTSEAATVLIPRELGEVELVEALAVDDGSVTVLTDLEVPSGGITLIAHHSEDAALVPRNLGPDWQRASCSGMTAILARSDTIRRNGEVGCVRAGSKFGVNSVAFASYRIKPRPIRLLPVGAAAAGGGGAYTLTAESGTFTLTGTAAGLIAARTLAAESAAFVLTGAVANLLLGTRMDAETGAYTWTGTAAQLLRALSMAGESGGYSMSGQDAALTYNASNTLDAESASFVLTGADANLLYGNVLVAESGSFTIAGTDATLAAARALSGEPGSYSLTGTDAALVIARLLDAATAAFTLTGEDASLVYNPLGSFTLVAESGSFTLTGNDANLLKDAILNGETGTYNLSGTEVSLDHGFHLSAEAGSFGLTGTDVNLLRGLVLTAESGSYLLTGATIPLIASGVPVIGRKLNIVSGSTARGISSGKTRNIEND